MTICLVGLAIAEGHRWNRSLSVHEFHVAETHRNQGISKRLMECVVEKASREGFRIIVCEDAEYESHRYQGLS